MSSEEHKDNHGFLLFFITPVNWMVRLIKLIKVHFQIEF